MLRWNPLCSETNTLWRFVVVAMLWGGAFQPVVVRAETTFVPSTYGTGRYDTNIFRAPQSRVPNNQLDDFVGTVGGDLKMEHKSRDVDGSLAVGGDFNAFVTNSSLNYATARVLGSAILDNWVGRLTQGAQLRLSQYFQYTPETPGFLSGAKGQIVDDPFGRGIQNFRANTFSNTTALKGLYPVYKALGIQASYSYSTRRFGSVFTQTAGGGIRFFDSDVHTYGVGPRYQLTPMDSISVMYSQQLLFQSAEGPTRKTNIQSVDAILEREMSNWKITVTGGASLIEPSSKMFAAGSLKISYQPSRSTTIELLVSRRAAPSFFILSGALISNLGRVQGSYRFSERLTFSGSVGYSFNHISTDTGTIIQNLTAGPKMTYALTRAVGVELFYLYSWYENKFITPDFRVSQNQVGFTLFAQWK